MAGILTPGSTGAMPAPAGPTAPSATPIKPLSAMPQLGRNPQTSTIPPPPGGAPLGAPPGAPPGGAPPPGTPPARLGDMFSAAPGATPGAPGAQAAMHANPTVDDALRAAWNPAIPDQQPGMLGPAMAQQQALMPRMNFVQPRIPQAIKRST